MRLRHRLDHLERRLGRKADAPTVVVLDVPGGQPDMILINGQLQAVPDGRAVLRGLDRRYPVSVITGIDPLVVSGEKKAIEWQQTGDPASGLPDFKSDARPI